MEEEHGEFRFYLPWPRERSWKPDDPITVAGETDHQGWVHELYMTNLELDPDPSRAWAWISARPAPLGQRRVVALR